MYKQTAFFITLIAIVFAAPVNATTFTVDITNDFPDKNIGDGICANILNQCTLRAAIQEANQTAALDNINFNIPGGASFYAIDILGTPLPPITAVVNIKADTQPGYLGVPLIQIKNGPSGQPGLVANASMQLTGLSITGMGGDGLQLNANGNAITQNYIGLDPLKNAAGNNGHGIHITSSGNSVGGSAGNGNVISSNTGSGIYIESPGNGNSILNNFIGTSPDGMTARGNGIDGVTIIDSDSNDIGQLFGTPFPNTISANAGSGVKISGAASFANDVLYNFIGSSGDGTAALGNSQWGVVVENGAHDNLVGDSAGSGNQVDDNGFAGIQITGLTSTNNSIRHNLVGVNKSGTAVLGAQGQGVVVNSADTVDIVDNTISGNTDGVTLFAASHINVFSNRIGTNKSGTMAIPNSENGISVVGGSQSVFIGSLSETDRNIISGNAANGIQVGSTATPTANTTIVITGNTIGLGADGLQAIPNQQNGVNLVSGAEGTILGYGLVIGEVAQPVISGNAGYGINIEVNAVEVRSNLVGIDLSENVARGNALGGIRVVGDHNDLGGMIVAGNGGDGINVLGDSNFIGGGSGGIAVIGTNSSLDVDLGNMGSGCVISGSHNIVQIISRFNQKNGLTLNDGINNNWVGSSFGNNQLAGVDIGNDGPDVNDPGDADDGANRRINAPEIITAEYDPGTRQMTVRYRISSDPGNQSYPLSLLFCQTDDDNEECLIPLNFFLALPTFDLADVGSDKTEIFNISTRVTLFPDRPLVGRVTDADGNSSETSAPAPLVVDLLIFKDGFESAAAP